ncbi:MAG: Kelch repeat-containing protein [Gammaproteobacteria bacterium]
MRWFPRRGDRNDLWRFHRNREEDALLAPEIRHQSMPEPRYCGTLAEFGGMLFLFGGRSRVDMIKSSNDLWIFDLSTGASHEVHGNRRPHRYNVGAVFPGYYAKSASAAVGKYWYIWGGEGRHGHVSDFSRLDLQSLVWQLVAPAHADDPRFW